MRPQGIFVERASAQDDKQPHCTDTTTEELSSPSSASDEYTGRFCDDENIFIAPHPETGGGGSIAIPLLLQPLFGLELLPPPPAPIERNTTCTRMNTTSTNDNDDAKPISFDVPSKSGDVLLSWKNEDRQHGDHECNPGSLSPQRRDGDDEVAAKSQDKKRRQKQKQPKQQRKIRSTIHRKMKSVVDSLSIHSSNNNDIKDNRQSERRRTVSHDGAASLVESPGGNLSSPSSSKKEVIRHKRRVMELERDVGATKAYVKKLIRALEDARHKLIRQQAGLDEANEAYKMLLQAASGGSYDDDDDDNSVMAADAVKDSSSNHAAFSGSTADNNNTKKSPSAKENKSRSRRKRLRRPTKKATTTTPSKTETLSAEDDNNDNLSVQVLTPVPSFTLDDDDDDQQEMQIKRSFSSSSPSSHTGFDSSFPDQEWHLRYHDIGNGNESIVPLTMDRLPVILNDLTRRGYEMATADLYDQLFVPNSSTAKMIQKYGVGAKSRTVPQGSDVLLWTLPSPSHGQPSSDNRSNNWPVLKARAIVNTTPAQLMEFLMDPDQVKTYNKMNQSKTTRCVFQSGLYTTTRSADDDAALLSGDVRIATSINKPKLLPKGIETTCLWHAQPLPFESLEAGMRDPTTTDSDSANDYQSFICTGRSVWETTDDCMGSRNNSASSIKCKNSTTTGDSELLRSNMIMGVQLIRPLYQCGNKNGLEVVRSEITTITHIVPAGVVPEPLAKRLAPAATVQMLKDIQAVFQ